MTRINSAINVKNLTDEHLLAEHREIKRICSNYTNRKSLNNLPNKFTLGTGHVLYFVDKPSFTLSRYLSIYNECLERGFNVDNYSSNWDVYDKKLFNNIHIPNNIEKNLLINRISERLNNSSKKYWHYNKKQITKEEALILLKNE
ncbi:pyrimidine dimer DNA glycosylase/endonuclease V [bacterium]|jgi:hypothetical protein|nr:pyrimidine dimer DNA glycosylase/endonuclease V [bacterium]